MSRVMREKCLPATPRKTGIGYLIVPSFLSITSFASDNNVTRNMQPHLETVHTIQVFDSRPVVLQELPAITTLISKFSINGVSLSRISHINLERVGYSAADIVKIHTDQLVCDVRL